MFLQSLVIFLAVRDHPGDALIVRGVILDEASADLTPSSLSKQFRTLSGRRTPNLTCFSVNSS